MKSTGNPSSLAAEQKLDAEERAIRAADAAYLASKPFSRREFLETFPSGSALNSKKLPTVAIQSYLNNYDYSKVEDYILMHVDHLEGVESYVEVNPAKYPDTHVGYVRDATHALPLAQRLLPDDPAIRANELLLRVLGTIRGIDHVLKYQDELAKRESKEDATGYELARAKLLEIFREFLNKVTNSVADGVTNPKTLKASKLEKEINSELIKLLHETKLDIGVKKPKEYSKLLGHYRNMAAVLDPARAVVTLTRDVRNKAETNGYEITQSQTSLPITVKTQTQKAQFKVMDQIKVNVPKGERDFHSAKNIAMQTVNVAFAKLAAMDNRRFAAQTRKDDGPGTKNAWKVIYESSFKKGNAISKADFTSLRTGSLAYIGFDDTDAHVKEYAAENMQQLMNAVPGKTLHFTMLLSPIIKEERLMINTTKEICDNTQQMFSEFPINDVGLWLAPKLAADIKQGMDPAIVAEIEQTDIFTGKESRIDKTAQVINTAIEKDNTINVTTCASGQDRTGIALLIAIMMWLENEYTKRNIPISRQVAEDIYMQGRDSAFVASAAAPGSDGMKKNSQQARYLSESTNTHLFRPDAETNKDSPVDKEAIHALLADWAAIANQNKTKVAPATREALEAAYHAITHNLIDAANLDDVKKNIHAWSSLAASYQHSKDTHTMHISRMWKNHNSPEASQIHNEVTAIVETLARATTADDSNIFPVKEVLEAATAQMSQLKRNYGNDVAKLGTVFSQLDTLISTANVKLTKIPTPFEEKTNQTPIIPRH